MDNAELRRFGELFIERRDVKAFQHRNGSYTPDKSPIKLSDLRDHIEGRHTMGHYLVSPENRCRLFAFDIDLAADTNTYTDDDGIEHEYSPREAWQDPEHPARDRLAIEMNCLAEGIARRATRITGAPVAIADSGNKGVHVYVFTGSVTASSARAAAALVLESFGVFRAIRGKNFWQHTESYKSFNIEIFPKQDHIDADAFGNLMRLPLGINLKTGRASRFVRCLPPLNELTMMDATKVLDGAAPWS